MKKLMYLFASLALVALAACGDKDGRQIEKPPVEEPQPEPGLPFTEYSLTGESGEEISARWINLDFSEFHSFGEGKVLVFDSEADLEKYVEGDYPPIDFSTKTLLLAYGVEGHGVVPDGQNFQQVSGRNYVMTVNLKPMITSVITEWQRAIVVNKLPSESKINLNITQKW